MRLWNLRAAVLALFVVACGGGSGTTVEPQEAGTLQLPLTSSSDGKLYRLVGATFNITGAQTVTVTDTAADTVQVPLQAGSYSIELATGWKMERVDAPGTPVPATLLSPNPLPFFMTKGQTTQVRFLFKLPGEGTADVGIEVDSGGWFTGSIQFEYPEGGSPNPYAELVGKSVPFVVSFKSYTTTRESWSRMTAVRTGPIAIQFGGAPSALLDRVAAALQGTTLDFNLTPVSGSGSKVEFSGGGLYSPATGIGIQFYPSFTSFEGVVDADGYPVFRPFSIENGTRIAEPAYGVSGAATLNASP